MSFKPGDFFLGAISFLGIFVPGALLLFLRPDLVPPLFEGNDPIRYWILFAGEAYIIGQLLHAVSELLNSFVRPVAPKLYAKLHKCIGAFDKEFPQLLPPELTPDIGSRFHAAISYVRLNNTEAAGEIDRHMADYKLLRNLVGVFVLDFLLTITDLLLGQQKLLRLGLDVGLAILFFACFVRMYCWTELLAFEYASLITGKQHPVSRPSAAGR